MIHSTMNDMPSVGNMIPQDQNMNNTSASNKQQHIRQPLNSFMVWCLERRRKIQSEHPEMHPSEISKKLGAEWKQMNIEEKRPYIIEAKILREQHMRDHPDYRQRRKPKPLVKRINAYILWCRERRRKIQSEHPERNTSQISKIIEEWKQLNDEEKMPFKDEANRLREQYMRDHPQFKPNDSKVVPYPLAPNWFPAGLDARNFMKNSQISAYEAEEQGNPIANSMFQYDMHFSPCSAPTYSSNLYCTESQQLTPMPTQNTHTQAVSANPLYKLMYATQNACGQDMNRSDSVHSNTSNSSAVPHSSPEPQQNGPSPAYFQSSSVPSQLPSAITQNFSFSTVKAEPCSTPPSMPLYGGAAMNYGSPLQYATQTSTPATFKSPASGRISENHPTARSEVPMPNPNSPVEQSQFLQPVYGIHQTDYLTSSAPDGLHPDYPMHMINPALCSQGAIPSQPQGRSEPVMIA